MKRVRFFRFGVGCRSGGSFKNSRQVITLCEYGIGATTISPDVLELLIKNDSVVAALHTFRDDFEKLCGKGKTMLDC